MKIKSIMTRNAKSCTPEPSVREAAAKGLSAAEPDAAVADHSMNDPIRGSVAEGMERARQASGWALPERELSPPTRWSAPSLAEERVPEGAGQEPLRVRDVMTLEVKSCGPQDTLASAALAMNRADCRFLPVVDPDGRPVGVITDGDICLLGATDHRPLREIVVHEVMNQPVTTFGPDADVLEVLRTMRSQRIRHVPVVGADGVLVGIVSLTDLVLCSEERGDRCTDSVFREIAATVREIAQKNPGGRSVRIHPFIES